MILNDKFRDVQDRYEHFRARCSSDKKVHNKTVQKGGNELGCTKSIYGIKARCKLHIVPHSQKGESLSIDAKCKGKPWIRN